MMEKIFKDIEAERRNQDVQWGGPEHDDELALRDWTFHIMKQLGRLANATNLKGMRARLVKIAALAVAAIESIDRSLTEE